MKKYMSAFLIPCLMLYLTGCYSMKPVSKDTIRSGSFHGDLQVLTTEGKSYKFKAYHYSIVDDSIKGKGIQSGIIKSIPDKVFEGSVAIQDIEHSVADEFDIGGTVVFAALTVGIVVLLVIAFSNFSLMDDRPLTWKFK